MSLLDKYNKITIRLLSRLEAVSTENPKGKVIYVTSASDAEGKTLASEYLAYCSATLTNNKVLLVDGNMDSPRVAGHFSIKSGMGLSNILVEGRSTSEAYWQTKLPNLSILPAGNKCRSELLFKKNNVEAFCNGIRDTFDLIFVDSSSISRSGSNSLASLADGVVLVIDSTSTRREVLQFAVKELNVRREKILGAILNKKRYYIPRFLLRIL